MIEDDFCNSRLEAADALEIAWTVLAETDGIVPTVELSRMLHRATEAMQRFTADLDAVHKLVRHGTNDHREFDARHAARELEDAA